MSGVAGVWPLTRSTVSCPAERHRPGRGELVVAGGTGRRAAEVRAEHAPVPLSVTAPPVLSRPAAAAVPGAIVPLAVTAPATLPLPPGDARRR